MAAQHMRAELRGRAGAKIAYYIAYALVLLKMISGSLSIGGMVMLTGALQSAQAQIAAAMHLLASSYEHTLFLRGFYEFLSLRPKRKVTDGALLAPASPQQGFAFSGVGFRY